MEPGTVVWRETAQSLLRQKWLILGCILLGLLGASVFALSQTERWTASSQLVIGPAVPPALVGKLSTSADKSGPLGMDLPAETQARVMASPTLLAAVVKQLGMPNDEAGAFRHACGPQFLDDVGNAGCARLHRRR